MLTSQAIIFISLQKQQAAEFIQGHDYGDVYT